MFKYALKRVIRGYKLSLALTIGVLIATTFFASMIMAADVLTQNSLEKALEDIDYDARVTANNITWSPSQVDKIASIMNGLTEVQSVEPYSTIKYNYNYSTGPTFDVIGLQQSSIIWQSLKYINGTHTLKANETYVVASSENASLFSIGDVISVPIKVLKTSPPSFETITVNLTIAGFVDISERFAKLLNPTYSVDYGYIHISMGDWRDYHIMLTDWNATMKPLFDWYSHQSNVGQIGVSQGFLCRFDRSVVINPYDISASISNVELAIEKISDRTAAYNTQVKDLVGDPLLLLSFTSSILMLSFVSLAAPIIFMSWYSSTMLSDVSYNLRRREFGLLQTKGFGPKSIKKMLQLEGVIIGLIAGVVGLFAGTGTAMIIANASLTNLLGSISGHLMNSVVVIIFALILARWSIRGPADRASKLEPLDALKQYVYIEEQRQYKHLFPRIALALGTYKIIVWALGINMATLLASSLRVNFLLFIVVALWSPVDLLLNFIGPIMFLYGLTKILLRGSQKFQEGIVKSAKRFFGTFGKLATRNVQRNPMRNAALVFVVSLIVSYGIFSVGSLFSQQDQLYRTNLYNVGSDVNAIFPTGTNVTGADLNKIAQIDGVTHITDEEWITLSTVRGSLEVRGINATTWRDTAFYEDSWFSGAPVDQIFSNFTGDKIVLTIALARSLELRVGNKITVRDPSNGIHQMTIVGLVGFASPLEDMVGSFAFSGNYPSFVPLSFIKSQSWAKYATPHILIKTAPSTNGTQLEQDIKALYPEVTSTDSITTRNINLENDAFQMAGIRSSWIGIAFAVALAVIGTGLVIGLTLKEKEYEVTLLGVRGFSRSQILKVLFGEVLVMVLFSLILGIGTGFVQLFGDISNNSQNTNALVRPRIVLGLIPILSMACVVLAVVLAALIPVIMASRLTEDKINILRE
ncbi:MAG: FtsX-like permease family protein [Candidatus Thorarchaeota archaeon]|nr:FtsX-like permease family protein [Candidatus Thorarchaeota archaeon]